MILASLATALTLVSSLALPASASNFTTSGWQTGFTVTTVSAGLNGSGDYVIEATWTHNAATLVTSGPASSGQLWNSGQRVLQCNSSSITFALNNLIAPAGCTSIASTKTVTLASNTLTVVYTISAANYNARTAEYLIPDTLWTDASQDDLVVPASGNAAGGSSTSVPAVYYGGPLVTGFDRSNFSAGSAATITLTGKRLAKVTTVTVDGESATILSQSKGRLVIEIPTLAAGRYDIVLNSTAGTLTILGLLQIN
jgi:hypothetical protein